MKIICTDNFNRESVADTLIAENIKNNEFAKVMCEALQSKFGGHNSDSYFKVVPDDYKLWGGMAELV